MSKFNKIEKQIFENLIDKNTIKLILKKLILNNNEDWNKILNGDLKKINKFVGLFNKYKEKEKIIDPLLLKNEILKLIKATK